jgi:hypothetical protein
LAVWKKRGADFNREKTATPYTGTNRMRDRAALALAKFHQTSASFPTEVRLVTPSFRATEIDADPREAIFLLAPRAPKYSICIHRPMFVGDQKEGRQNQRFSIAIHQRTISAHERLA